MRFSTLKKSAQNPLPSVLALRDAALAGLAVAAAIIFGAWIVYSRACDEKIDDLQTHLGELADRLSRLMAGAHKSILDLPPEKRAELLARRTNPFTYIRDHTDDARRIYSFSLDNKEPLTLLDTGLPGAKPAAVPLPPHARNAREHFRRDATPSRHWLVADGLETTAFAPILDANQKSIGVFAIEADSERLVQRLAGIQHSFFLTCILGVVAGAASGAIVWRMRLRSARAQAQIEETRRVEQETLRLFFDETATAHFALDGDTLVDANPAALALFGAPDKDALLSLQVWSLWPRRQSNHALSVEVWSDQVLASLESGGSRFEWQFSRLDGALVDCNVFLRHTVFHGRDVLLAACYDITATKRAQAQLIESEQRFRDVSEAIGEFIWEVDQESRYTYASRRVMQVLGLEPEAVLGRTPFDFVPAEDAAEVRARSRAIFDSGHPFRDFEHRVLRADGSLLWISASGTPNFDATGKIVGYRGASLDITKHRAYEQELVLQKEAAEAADRAKSNFLAMMSHEIRTPLNSVLGFADLLLATQLDPTQHEHLRTIRHSGDGLLLLLNDILDFSKIESDRMEVEIVPTDILRCAQEVIDLYRPAAAEKNLTLHSEIAADAPRHVLTDPTRLRQILVNLVGNAVKFTAAGEVRIRVSLLPADPRAKTPRVRFVVSDTGIGITPAQRSRLFLPFTQADSSTTRRFGGTGLGLAISHRLAILLGGELGLEDASGSGSAFFLTLPATPPAANQIPIEADGPETGPPFPEATPALPSRSIRVLVVDDNTLNRRLTSMLLEQFGATTEVAESAEECFKKIAAHSFDLVLMDVQMPGMDGLEATRRIRRAEAADGERRAPLNIVALTADAMVGDRERCLAAGMDDYLTKPLRRDALARVVRRIQT